VPSESLVADDLADALAYQRRQPEDTVLYRVVQHNLEAFLASARLRLAARFACWAYPLQGRVAAGPRAGQHLLRLGDRIDVEDAEAITGPRCASVQGFRLHADVCVPARDAAPPATALSPPTSPGKPRRGSCAAESRTPLMFPAIGP
jgi:hypothetical protein